MSSSTARWQNTASANLWLAAAYLASSWICSVLAPAAARPAALAPATAVAIAVLYTYGWQLLPGLAVAALIAADPRLFPQTLPTVASQVAPWLPAAAAVLQAVLAVALLRRLVAPQLAAARDVLRFVLLVPLACTVRASVVIGGTGLLGQLPPNSGQLWLACWAADSTAVLLLAPLCWVLFGRPLSLWRGRRLSVALPMLVTAVMFVLVHRQNVHAEQARQLQTFRLKAQEVGHLLQAALHEHERFLAGVARTLDSPDSEVTPQRFSDIAKAYLRERPELLAMAWLPRVTAEERAALELAATAQFGALFGILDYRSEDSTPHPAGARPEYYPLLFIEPDPERLVRGADFLSEPSRAQALRRALATRAPAATEPLVLRRTGLLGMVLLQAVGPAGGPPDGVLALALRVDSYVGRALSASQFTAFQVELSDVTPGGLPRVMMDTIGADYRPPDYRTLLELGGRRYALRLAPAPHYLAAVQANWRASGISVTGLLLAALMSALMLIISGERARVEALVGEATARLREREARLQAILDHAGDAIVTVDAGGMLLTCNRAAARLFRCEVGGLCGQSLGQLLNLPTGAPGTVLHALARADLNKRELVGTASDGALFPLLVSVSPVSLGAATIFVCIMHDLTEQRRAQAHIHQLAHRDALTGLENRLSLTEHLEQLVAQARRAGTTVALLFLDLDHFKKINDSQGHHAGDLLLVEVAGRLRELLRDVDIIARLGGDEFIVAMSGTLTPELVGAKAMRVVHALSQPYCIDGQVLHSGTSVGIAMFPGDADNPGTLMRHADMAMYAAKSVGRGNFQFFSPAMNAATHERLEMESRLRHALGAEEFQLYLQPQVDLISGRVVGAEALLRWHQPELGIIMPNQMIPIAEESGLILPVGDWVMNEAIKLLAGWKHIGLGHLRMAVNLSARQCHGRDLLPRLDALLADSGVAPSQLELEITESAAMHDPEYTRALLRQLRARGIQVAIDDFGTGYSSLSYLKLFAIDRIKIDRAFVTDIETDPNDAVIVSATIGLAHSLGLAVIAEGVETSAQRGFLARHDCDEGQGFLFARPMPVDEFNRFVQEKHTIPMPA